MNLSSSQKNQKIGLNPNPGNLFHRDKLPVCRLLRPRGSTRGGIFFPSSSENNPQEQSATWDLTPALTRPRLHVWRKPRNPLKIADGYPKLKYVDHTGPPKQDDRRHAAWKRTTLFAAAPARTLPSLSLFSLTSIHIRESTSWSYSVHMLAPERQPP